MRFITAVAAVLALCVSGMAQATPPVPAFIPSTPPLSAHEMDVSKVYLAVFGRTPELSGLNYWASQTPPTASIEQIYNTIAALAGPTNISPANENNFEFVKYIYAYILGKSYQDDPSGVQ
jgi:hypothetical protein